MASVSSSGSIASLTPYVFTSESLTEGDLDWLQSGDVVPVDFTLRCASVSPSVSRHDANVVWVRASTKYSPGVLSIVLCSCVLCLLSFPELNSPFQMGCSTKCVMLVRCSVYIVSIASGRLTVQKASGTRRAPSIRWKALAARYRTLQLWLCLGRG